jgi:hypothetical protein
MIPVMLLLGWVVPAKIIGVVTVVLLSISVRYWLYNTKKEFDPKERIRINLNDRYWMQRELPFYNALDKNNKRMFEDRMGVFLARVPVCLSSGELLMDRQKALKIAATLVKEIDVKEELSHCLPAAVIVEMDTWVPSMQDLRLQENVKVITLSSI